MQPQVFANIFKTLNYFSKLKLEKEPVTPLVTLQAMTLISKYK